MREISVEKYLKKEVKKQGGICLKFISPTLRGVPDRIVLIPEGRIFFVELKAPNRKARPHQQRVHKLFESLGVRVYVADSKEAVKEILKNEVCTAQLSEDSNR